MYDSERAGDTPHSAVLQFPGQSLAQDVSSKGERYGEVERDVGKGQSSSAVPAKHWSLCVRRREKRIKVWKQNQRGN